MAKSASPKPFPLGVLDIFCNVFGVKVGCPLPVLWLRSNSTFTFFGILSEIETFYVSSTKSVEATTSCDPVKRTDFLTCSAINWYKTSLLPLVKLFGGQGGRVTMGLLGGLYKSPNSQKVNL